MAESAQSSNFEAVSEDDCCSGLFETENSWVTVDAGEYRCPLPCRFTARRTARSEDNEDGKEQLRQAKEYASRQRKLVC